MLVQKTDFWWWIKYKTRQNPKSLFKFILGGFGPKTSEPIGFNKIVMINQRKLVFEKKSDS